MTQSQIDPPITANRTERRSSTRKRRVPLVLVLVPVALVAIAAVLILVLGGGEDGVLGIGGDDSSDEVPPFEFRLAKSSVVATVEEADVATMRAEVEALATEIVPVVDDLYTNAFLDPTNWREGDYEEVFASFAAEALPFAQEDVATLTLGAAAGDVYRTVTPRSGSLRFDVLFDREGVPATVVVEVRFKALGERRDGTFTSIVSVGQLFLDEVDGWKVTAFDVRRSDRETEPPSPSPSGSASGSLSS